MKINEQMLLIILNLLWNFDLSIKLITISIGNYYIRLFLLIKLEILLFKFHDNILIFTYTGNINCLLFHNIYDDMI